MSRTVLRPEFVERKLQLITDDLATLGTFRTVSYESFIADNITVAAVERILERIVMRAIDINEHVIATLAQGDEAKTTRLTYRDSFLRLTDYGVYTEQFAQRIAPSAGLRNILVHEYNDVEHRIVHGAIKSALEDYTDYAGHVRDYLRRSAAGPST